MAATALACLISLGVCMWDPRAEGREGMSCFKLLPQETDGWSASAKDEVHTRDTIFRYMNGAGELYLAYDFRQLWVREYMRPGHPSLVLEVYNMGSARDAFGIFTNELDGERVHVGQGATYGQGLLRFWKGRIFVRLMAEKETAETRSAVLNLGKKIADAIHETGDTPDLLRYLPSEGLLENSVHYFHTQVTLNFLYYLAHRNLLGLNANTEALLARYRSGDRKVRFLLVRYPTPQEAHAAYREFGAVYLRDRPETSASTRIEQLESNEYVSATWLDRFLALVFEAGDAEICTRLNSAVEKLIKENNP